MEWQQRIADVIAEAEKALPAKHLISQNVANGAKKISAPFQQVSIFNFHYADPLDAVAQNYALNKVIGNNETGFKGTADDHYRMEAWEFLLAGGGLFNNLDYSFTVGHEDGTFQYPATQPGGGNPGYRKQLKTLGGFLRSFDFIRMKPARAIVEGGLPEKARAQVLAEEGKAYAMYFKGAAGAELSLKVPAGTYRAEFMDPVTGNSLGEVRIDHSGPACVLQLPKEAQEVAVKMIRMGD